MSRLIDADAFLAENCADRLFYDPKHEIGVASCDECNCHCLEIGCDRIMDAPTIDAVEVIRCENCKWWDKKDESGTYGYCHAIKHSYYSRHWEISIYRTYEADFFCADAEPKEEEEEGEEDD